jgi:hypothetical protein
MPLVPAAQAVEYYFQPELQSDSESTEELHYDFELTQASHMGQQQQSLGAWSIGNLPVKFSS